jgi:mannose/fructose/N-acetylgalactosamine-specific phosphotransferase system component IIB
MSPICWARVDDRLIHGQVVLGWRQHLAYDEIWVVDDEVSADPFLGDVLRMAAPGGVIVRVYGVAEAAQVLLGPKPTARVLLLFKQPQAALSLVEVGVDLPYLNVGNLAARPGARRVFRTISLTDEQAAALDALAARGVRITFQLAPDDAQADWQRLRESWRAPDP